MTTKRTNSLGGNKQARKQANAKRINAWRTARLALLLGLSLGLGIGAYSGSAFAVEHEIDGTTGKTFADVVNEGVIASGDTIKVIGSQSTGPASDYDALSFSIASSTTDNVTISGLGGNQRIFDGGSRRNTFEILGNETVTFTNAHNTNSGGGVFSITGYISNIPGIGAIPNPTGKITLQGINFADSSAKQGGAGYIDLAKGLSIDSVAFSGNSASSQGGALWLNNMMGDMSISNATFSENESVGGAGGAIYVDSYNKSNLTLENVTFEDNAGTRGGAIYVNDDITPVTLSGTNVFTNNDSTTADTEYGLGGGAILSKSTVTISGDNSFTDNTAVSAGGAISVCTASGAAENSNVKFTGDDGKYTFTDNTAGTKGGAVYSQGDVTFSGQNVTASFTGNEVTDGIMQTGEWAGYYEVQGHDIFAESDIHITGTGTYTFDGGVWAEGDGNLNANTIYDDGDFVMTKAGEGDLILTTGDTDMANTKYYSYGTISANNKVTLDGVIFQDSHLNTTDNAKVEGEVSGILFGNFGVNLYDTTVQNNSITADTTIAGTVYANTGSTTLWADETGRYSTLAGTTTFDNNVITSSEGSAGGAICSATYLFLGAAEGVNKPVAANGSDIAFNSNQAVGTGDATAEGGAVYTYRNVLLQSNDNTITFSGNKATAAAGDAFGGAIAALAYYDHGNDTGEFGVDFAGDGNDVLFSGNEATSTGGKGYGGAIAAYMGRDTANTPAVQLHGTDSLYAFENNEATTAGGAIYSEGNTLLKGEGSTFEFTGNTAGQNGGAVAVVGAVDSANVLVRTPELTVSGATFDANSAYKGGAIFTEYGGKVVIEDSDFTNNGDVEGGANAYQGGAVHLRLATNDVSISDSTFTNNSTGESGAGGAFYISAYRPEGSGTPGTPLTVNMENVEFEGNTGSRGGAIFVNNGTTTLKLSGENTFENNTSTMTFKDGEFGYGGGAIVAWGNGTMEGSNTFTGNTTDNSNGGAFSTPGAWTLSGETGFNSNEATVGDGGAIYHHASTNIDAANGALTIEGTSTFSQNKAGNNGGAIADVSNELLTISNSEFVSNEAGNNGGAIYSEGSVSVENTYFVDNSAGADGGAIYLKGNTSDQSLTITASGSNEVLFDGNTGVVEGDMYDNAIAFMGTDVIGTKRIDFNAVGDSTISVLDGMEVDLAFDGSGEGSFTMDLVGTGTQNWDGQNNFRITNNAIGTVKLTSGNINLAKDFQMANVEGGTLNVNITGGDNGAQIGVDLNGRNTGFAMFDNPTEFNVDGVANVKIKTLRAFSDGEEEMWLVTDKRGDVGDASFKLTDDSPIVETSIKTVDNNLYIAVVNKADEIIANSADPNARRVRESVEETWNQAAEELAEVLPEEQVDGIYNEIIANTEVYTAEGIVSQAFGALDLTHQVMRQVYDYNRLGDQYDSGCSNDQTADIPLRAWGGYMGADGSLDTDGYHGFDQSWQGVLGGVSREGGNGGTIGTWFGYADGRNRFEDISTRLENKAYNTGVFAIFRLNNNTSLASDFTYGHYDNEARRSNQAGLYSGKFDQDTYGGGLTLRRDIVNGNRIFTPLVGVRYQHLVQGEYDEIANGVGEFANSLDAFTADSMQSRVGATFTTGFETANGRVISPMIYGMWRHEFMDNDFSTIGYYQSDSNEFMVASIARERDLADLGGTLSVSNNCTTVGVGYNATVTEGYRQHNWFAGMSYRF
ncbi:MAG: autotransporter domain-containing protein [Planctomycetia bacterium]|nr:autotransporter domain-containing protein [Planctomycetia bacterium]